MASCRIAAYPRSALRFVDVTIAEFSDEQIEAFICRWFSSPEDKALGVADEYIELLNQDDHRATKELAQTPLLLTFLCLVYDREQTLPSQRSTLYGRALNIILHEWSAQKRIKRSEIYKGFHPDLEKIMLAEIAYESFKADQLFFSKRTVKGYISRFLSDMLGAPEYLDAEAVLEAIEVQQGIVVERATDFYSFSHLTLQEYLTALHIVENHLEEEVIEQYLVDERWREVFLLIAGVKGRNVLQLLEAMRAQSQTYPDDYAKLHRLVRWSASSQQEKTELYQRATMLSIASAIARDIIGADDHWFLRAETFNSLADRLSAYQAQLQNLSAGSAEEWRSWADELLSYWLRLLKLELDDIQFSSAEAVALKNYLYANELTLQCKKAAIYISSEQWKRLEESLLTIDG